MNKFKKMADKGIAYFKRNGMRGFAKRLVRKAVLMRPVTYRRWFKKHRVSARELAGQRAQETEDFVRFGVCIYGKEDSKAYKETMESLRAQSYQGFVVYPSASESNVNYVLIVKEGTTAEADMFYTFAAEIRKHPEAELLYCDHDERRIGKKGTCDPHCKPEFDLYFLRSQNYIGNAFLVSADLLTRVGVPDRRKGDALFYDYLLRCAEKTGQTVRIARILFHEYPNWMAYKQEMQALKEHYDRLLIPAKIRAEKKKGIYLTEYHYHETPLLSVIIPNKDQVAQLAQCVESILKEGGYENLEILIVENNSQEEETFRCYERLQGEDARVRVLTWQGEFEYSKINNDAVQKARGSYLLFLNNDTKVKKAGCLAELMNAGRREDVGAVGARLFYGDGTIQHGGVVLGYGGIAGHAFEGMTAEEYEKVPFVPALRRMSAVTAACMLVKREAFEAAGGFCEELKIAYNDVDLCLKIGEKGFKVLYCPQAELYHYESQTRGLELTREKAQRVLGEQQYFREKWKEKLAAGDPWYNPNLTLEKADHSLAR